MPLRVKGVAPAETMRSVPTISAQMARISAVIVLRSRGIFPGAIGDVLCIVDGRDGGAAATARRPAKQKWRAKTPEKLALFGRSQRAKIVDNDRPTERQCR
jgi:hypothetical protein